MAVRAVLAVTLLLSGAQTASADDLKDCTSAPPDQAIVACTNLIEGGKFDSQEQAIAYTNRGVALRKKGGLERALADFDRAVELDSGQAPIYANRDVVHQPMNDFDRALADFNRAIKLEPNNAVVYLNRCVVYQRSKDADDALATTTAPSSSNRNRPSPTATSPSSI